MAKAQDSRRMPKKDYEARVPQVREELIQMQVTLQQAQFPVLLIVAGDEAAGKGEVVNLLNGWLDPRGVETFAFHAMTDEERERPPMWRYWRSLPPRGRTAIYVGGWHQDALAQQPRTPRALAHFDRTLERLAHFESLLVADGALIVKVWLRLSRADQRARLLTLEADPDTAWRATPEDWRNHRSHNRLSRLAERMRRVTHSPESPWHVIDATDVRTRNLGVAEHLLARFKSHQEKHRQPGKATRPTRVVPLRSEGRKRLQAVQLDQRLSENVYEEKPRQMARPAQSRGPSRGEQAALGGVGI